LAQDPDEQSYGADHAGDQASHEGGGLLSGWSFCADAGGCQIASHSIKQVGHLRISEHEEAL